MSLESFYGGKQGVSPVVKARFKYVDTNDLAYQAAISNANGDTEKLAQIAKDTMETCFADVSYTDVWYGQLAIIDTENKRNKNNGKLFRRVLARSENDIAKDGGTLHGEYIGRIVGPSEGFPKVILGSPEDMINKVQETFRGTDSAEYVFPTSDDGNIFDGGIITNSDQLDFDTTPNGRIHELKARKDKGTLIPGAIFNNDGTLKDTEKGIHYSWVNVRENIGDEEEDTYVYLGFQIPYTYLDFYFSELDWNKEFNSSFENKNAYQDGSQPFYQKWNIQIPRGTQGNHAGYLRRMKFGDFINSNEEKTDILYRYTDLYKDETGKFEVIDYEGNYPQFEEDNLNANSSILVYTYYMYDKTYENKNEIVNCYLGKINDIETVILADDGTFKVEYASGETEAIQIIKWITNIESVPTGRNTDNPSGLKITYNTYERNNEGNIIYDDETGEPINETQIIGPFRFIEDLFWAENPERTQKTLNVLYTDNQNGITETKEILSLGNTQYNFVAVNGLKIDDSTKEVLYHTDPINAELTNDDAYRSFPNPTYLNAIEQTFIGSDGHLYIKYTSTQYNYDGEPDSAIGEPYLPNVRYYHIDDKNQIWRKGGDLPDSIGKPQSEWKWWLDLGVVEQTVNGLRIAQGFNTERFDAYRVANSLSTMDWDNTQVENILAILNSEWYVNEQNVSPYTNGHIYTYNTGENTNFNTMPIRDDMGQLVFFKGNAYFYDFGEHNDEDPALRGKQWKHAGSWSEAADNMQLKIETGPTTKIPSDQLIGQHKYMFNFLVDWENSISGFELENIWEEVE